MEIKMNYQGRDIEIDAPTEKEAMRQLKARKREIDKLNTLQSEVDNLALTRAKASVCTIAERIQRRMNGFNTNWNSRYVQCESWEAWKGGKFYFSNRHGHAVHWFWCGSEEQVNEIQVIEAVDGPIAVYDPCTKSWCAIGIATAHVPGIQSKVSFVEIPSFIAAHIGEVIRTESTQAA